MELDFKPSCYSELDVRLLSNVRKGFEPPRLSRRLRTLRGLEHEQIGEVRTRGA